MCVLLSSWCCLLFTYFGQTFHDHGACVLLSCWCSRSFYMREFCCKILFISLHHGACVVLAVDLVRRSDQHPLAACLRRAPSMASSTLNSLQTRLSLGLHVHARLCLTGGYVFGRECRGAVKGRSCQEGALLGGPVPVCRI